MDGISYSRICSILAHMSLRVFQPRVPGSEGSRVPGCVAGTAGAWWESLRVWGGRRTVRTSAFSSAAALATAKKFDVNTGMKCGR
jgi:hypothetical protein